MDRRGFLTTTFAGGLAVTGGACAGVRDGETSEVPLADDELERKLSRIDTALERMNHKHSTRWFHEQRQAAGAPLPTEADRERLTHEGELMRASLRSALLLSSVAELPEANRSDPRVVERVEQIAGEADYAVLGTLAKLRSLDASELAALDVEFAGASPGMELAERIDELSDKLGVPASRRLHFRRMAKHLDWKLERERFSSVVGEVVGQVERAVEAAFRSLGADGAAAGAPAMALVGPDLNWVERTREVVRFYAPADDAPTGEPAATPQPQPAEPPTYSQADQTAWVNEQQRYQQQRDADARAAERAKLEKEQRTGTILAGTSAGLLVLGGVAVGVGVPYVVASAGAVVAVSLGGVGITIGMILLIVGLVLIIRSKRDLARAEP